MSDIEQNIERTGCVANSGTGNAVINISNYYYYYGESKQAPSLPNNGSDSEQLPCPYRGLSHFGPNDAKFFYGRDTFVDKLVTAVGERSFVSVIGASGSGKSSVVFAGLVPALEKQGNWLFTHFRPGADPFYALAFSLVPLYRSNLDSTDEVTQAHKLANSLQSEQLITDVLTSIHVNHPNCRLLVIADQFEELYTVCNDDKTRKLFLDCLLTIISSSNSEPLSTVLVTTMRSDFFDNALLYRPLTDVLSSSIKTLGPMNPDELQQVIEKPAENLGVTFEDGLVKRILEDVESSESLPLLEFALEQLWKHSNSKQLTHVNYSKIGSVKDALLNHANQVYNNLNSEDKQCAKQIFIRLVQVKEKNTRRTATKAKIGDANWKLVQYLANKRLVITNRTVNGEETVEVIHEALIRHWEQLQTWVEEKRNLILQRDEIEDAAKEWDKNKSYSDFWNYYYLWVGKRLKNAKIFLKETKDLELSELSKNFIKASQRLEISILFSSCVMGLIFILVCLFFVNNDFRLQGGINEGMEIANLIKIPKDEAKRNQLQKEFDDRKSYLNLSNKNFENSDLKDINFPIPNLIGINFKSADLSSAGFGCIVSTAPNIGERMTTPHAVITCINLANTNFNAANLSNANLQGANLSNANFSNANLSQANFSVFGKSALDKVPFGVFDNSRKTDLKGANLSGANVYSTNFTDVINLTPEQVKLAKNWQQACYDSKFRKQLGIELENPKYCPKE